MTKVVGLSDRKNFDWTYIYSNLYGNRIKLCNARIIRLYTLEEGTWYRVNCLYGGNVTGTHFLQKPGEYVYEVLNMWERRRFQQFARWVRQYETSILTIWKCQCRITHLRDCPMCLSRFHCNPECRATRMIASGWSPSSQSYRDVQKAKRKPKMSPCFNIKEIVIKRPEEMRELNVKASTSSDSTVLKRD